MKIKKMKRFLPFALVSSMILSNIVPVFAESKEVQISGEIKAATIDISTNITASVGGDGTTYTIDPNAEDGNYLTSNEITIINGSNFPIKLGVADAENQTNNLTDVLPTDVGSGTKEDWYALGKTDSESKIALGLKNSSGTKIKNLVEGITYFKTIQDLEDSSIDLGVVGAGGSISYEVDGFHGLAFSQAIETEKYNIVFDVSLYDGNADDLGNVSKNLV